MGEKDQTIIFLATTYNCLFYKQFNWYQIIWNNLCVNISNITQNKPNSIKNNFLNLFSKITSLPNRYVSY